ncbi:chemotaxis protein [Azospirillum sp. RWY-5-1]|uniref:Chemotaxis protein n=1 Tax=Azospirillum oleiclasticum TaxID=2735135 RepID=A0ABX2TKH6_9PROT|nr:chemotaxis protein CheW [Azospirillum oleiclasticum]NYZ15937.1 chemotaxis protein [Azospirillum oleiclasticum]NYZ23584.1 chemotaxis protein [Azospirillum oleiclasticum]
MTAGPTAIDWTAVWARLSAARSATRRIEEERLDGLFRRRADHLARPPESAERPAGAIRALTARIGRERYALPVTQAGEVAPLGRWVPVPGWPPALLGVVNRRGVPCPVIDLHHLLNAGAPSGTAACAVALRRPVQGYAVRIDEVGEILDLDATAFTIPGGREPVSPLVAGVGPDGLILLDLNRLDAIPAFPILRDAPTPS